MLTPLAVILTTLVTLPVAHFLPRTGRLVLLSAAGAALLLFVAPASCWVITLVCVQALVLEALLRRLPKASLVRQYLPYVLLLNMFYTDLANAWPGLDLATAGVAFSVIRVFMTTKQLLAMRESTWQARLVSVAAGGFFVPALAVGPVFSGTTLWTQAQPGGKEPEGTTESMYRMLFAGWLLAVLVGPGLTQLTADGGPVDRVFPLTVLALFLSLFAAFWGQSLIAQAGAALAGFTVPQNFNRPWLAVDMRDFWNRWHISMAKFVMQYIYLPLNLRGVPPKIATVAAFVFMGLWHEVKPGYLLWGLAHGVILAYGPKVAPTSGRGVRLLSRVLTLSVVVSLSYLANHALKG